ncbi:MAG: hypothetical protein R2688_01380 [Fimbriimonadaceae bacterium]
MIRRWKLEQHRKKMMYWAPTMAGAIVAGVGFLAMLQIVTAQPFQFSGGAGISDCRA